MGCLGIVSNVVEGIFFILKYGRIRSLRQFNKTIAVKKCC
ncbi:MAG: hypothetical protein BWY70_01050 [Bacteroidetes bacterium ADurb.Bin408]|nr:MAG: hypothetical protein BWY70_01050 [Bacteroidetes bacterium ADurb.Bin408]